MRKLAYLKTSGDPSSTCNQESRLSSSVKHSGKILHVCLAQGDPGAAAVREPYRGMRVKDLGRCVLPLRYDESWAATRGSGDGKFEEEVDMNGLSLFTVCKVDVI